MIGDRVNDAAGRVYCGPTAISALTGHPISIIYDRTRRVRNKYDRGQLGRARRPGGRVLDTRGRKRRIMSMGHGAMLDVLARLGRKVAEQGGNYPTLRAFCEDRAHQQDFLVEVSRHYVAVGGGMICDTLTGGQAVPVGEYRRLNRKVRYWWRLSGDYRPGIAAPTPRPPRLPKPKPDLRAVRRSKTAAMLKRWESRRRRAETAIRKLKRKLRYYERLAPTS